MRINISFESRRVTLEEITCKPEFINEFVKITRRNTETNEIIEDYVKIDNIKAMTVISKF